MDNQQASQKPCVPMFGRLVCSRASTWGGKPCDEAEEVPFVRVDRRKVGDSEAERHVQAEWDMLGRNHRVENGELCRDFDDNRWMVRIDDGRALEAFCQKYGNVILMVNNSGAEPVYEIEIYDCHRE